MINLLCALIIATPLVGIAYQLCRIAYGLENRR